MTYERILKEIKKPNRDLARRVLQCLVVATRPPRVAELAEVLAVDFDDAEGIPKLKSDWRWEDQEQALLIACSSLIAIVEPGDAQASDNAPASASGDNDHDIEADDSRIVQFSHFSVKEFLTSSRLATAGGEVRDFYIDLVPAHVTLTEACLSVLLQIRDGVDGHIPEDHPLALYAAEHWTTHAQFGEVSPRLHKGMECLFETNKPHFQLWLTAFDIDTELKNDATFTDFAVGHRRPPAGPLYYAALCGFRDLVERLIAKHPQEVNVDAGRYVRPLVAALAGGHFQTADLLHHNGADLCVQGQYGKNPLHAAATSRNFEVIRILVEYDPGCVHARTIYKSTPLHWASSIGDNSNDGSVARFLLEHGADINAQNRQGLTPLHWASNSGTPEVVRVLLEHGADVEVKDDTGRTALHWTSSSGRLEVVRLLLEHGADVVVKDNSGKTALHWASKRGKLEIVHLLLEQGADVEVKNNDGKTALQLADGHDKVVELLREYGAK